MVLILVSCAPAAAGEQEPAVRDAMARAADAFLALSLNGGFAGIYSDDPDEQYGEGFYDSLPQGRIWLQPPGTPSVGKAFLRAWRATGEQKYLDAATAAGRAVAWSQSRPGGWEYTADVTAMPPDFDKVQRVNFFATFDDNTSQENLSFLMDLDADMDAAWLDRAVRSGLKYMIEAQYDNGAWPQWYPLKSGYHDYYTFNDGAMNDCVRVMLEAYRAYGREEFLESALAAGRFMIASRLAPPQAGWAQQYGPDMQPAWARAFEPPGVSPAPTAHNIRTLTDLYILTGDEAYLAPVPAAIAWMDASQLSDGVWSRLYELETNRPIYGDRDSKVHYTLEEISEERRTGYGWQGGFGVRAAVDYYNKAREQGAEAMRGLADQQLPPEQKQKRVETVTAQARAVIGAMDEQGRWVRGGYVHTEDFVKNFNVLCAYVELSDEGD